LVHTLRYFLDRYGWEMVVLTETESTALLQSQPAVLARRLVRLPTTQRLDGKTVQTLADLVGLSQALTQAGAWVQRLPHLDSWAVITNQLAFSQVLKRGRLEPPPGYERFEAPTPPHPKPVRRPEDNPNFVDPWLGKRSAWHGINRTSIVRRMSHE
jgi:hypothetical protein